MTYLKRSHQFSIGIILVALFISTRDYHFASFQQLPSASWAVFFLAGLYLQSRWVLPALLLLAGAIDAMAIGWGNVSSYCVTPAYAMLIPAYSILWLGGRWCAQHIQFNAESARTIWIPMLSVSLFSAIGCELFSGGGFYAFSNRFVSPTLAGYADRFVTYFPSYLLSMLFWVVLAACVHVACLIYLRKTAS